MSHTHVLSNYSCLFVKQGISGMLCSNDKDDERKYTYFLNNNNCHNRSIEEKKKKKINLLKL